MQPVVIQASQDSGKGFQCYGGAEEFWKCKEPEVILGGPYECVAGETRIVNPEDSSYHSIDWYFRRGIAPLVLTTEGPAQATVPFIKGYAPLYRVTLDNGQSFIATLHHRVLTDVGWLCVASLQSIPRPSNSYSLPLVGFRDGTAGALVYGDEGTAYDARWTPYFQPAEATRLFQNTQTLNVCTVKSIEFERVDFYYDLHVPGAENYLAEGVFHHNSGKTYAVLQKLNALLAKYPNTHALMVRQTYKSLLTSAVVTYEKKVLPFPPGHKKSAISSYGKNRPEWYDYPNGSRLVLGGMDNADKFLSAEFDVIYVNQAEEISLDSWEKLTSRATGRAGNMPYSQVMGDCNPGDPLHWIKNRPGLKLINSTHRDNPVLYDHDKDEWTEQGERTLNRLKRLTGARYKRGFLGLWVGVEGQVYEHFDPAVHLLPPDFKIPEHWPRYRSIDFGYRNPFVCQWWAVDEDERLYLYKEIYRTGRTVNFHSSLINRASKGEEYVATIADHDAEDRATLEENGIKTRPAKKNILKGIEACQERFKIQDDGRPRIFFVRDARMQLDMDLKEEFKPTSTIEEITGYVYDVPKEGKPYDEVPINYNDHGCDAMRYMVMHIHRKRNLKAIPLRYA